MGSAAIGDSAGAASSPPLSDECRTPERVAGESVDSPVAALNQRRPS